MSVGIGMKKYQLATSTDRYQYNNDARCTYMRSTVHLFVPDATGGFNPKLKDELNVL